MDNNITTIIELDDEILLEEITTCASCGCIIEDGEETFKVPGNTGAVMCRDCCEELCIVCEDCNCTAPKGFEVEVHDRNGNVVKTVCRDCAEKYYYQCEDCGEWFESEELMYDYHDGGYICRDCAENGDYFFCSHCGVVCRYDDEVIIYDWRGNIDSSVCEDCADDNYYRCDECGRYYDRTSISLGVSLNGATTDLCDVCRDDVHYCEECDGYWTDENWNYNHNCCHTCANAKGLILDYDADIDWIEFGVCDDHFGIELEIEEPTGFADRGLLAQHLHDRYLGNHAVYKHDGSLQHGFEVVTHPHTYEEFKKLPWREILAVIDDYNFKSHDGGRCGLHIHVDRKWFGRYGDEQYRNIAKLVFVYNWCWNFFLTASRRTEEQYKQWANRYHCSEDLAEVQSDVENIDGSYAYRYRAINLAKSNTVEFRLGRGTLRYESFMAWIDIHLALVRNVRNIDPNSELTDLTKWLDGITDATKEYLAYRGLTLFKLDESEEK